MNSLTHFKKILILPLLIVLGARRTRIAYGRARGRRDRLEHDCVKHDRRDCGTAAGGAYRLGRRSSSGLSSLLPPNLVAATTARNP